MQTTAVKTPYPRSLEVMMDTKRHEKVQTAGLLSIQERKDAKDTPHMAFPINPFKNMMGKNLIIICRSTFYQASREPPILSHLQQALWKHTAPLSLQIGSRLFRQMMQEAINCTPIASTAWRRSHQYLTERQCFSKSLSAGLYLIV